MNWLDYRNFSEWEFKCRHTGENKMRPEFVELLQQIRNTFGHPMIIASGYRHWTHPQEIHKDKPGAHTYGMAADIKIYGERARDLTQIALGYGIKRIGLNQKGPVESRFIHIDTAEGFPEGIWTY